MHVQLSAPELRNLLANALLFVDTSKEGLEALDGVLLHAVNGSLAATSTDRYRLAEILATATHLDADFHVFVTRAQAKAILEHLKPELKKIPSMITLKHDRETARIIVSTPWSDRPALILDAVENRFPKARNLFPANPFHKTNDYAMAHVNVEYLASFMRVKDYRPNVHKHESLLLIAPANPKKPLIMLRGDWFRGMLMAKSDGHLPTVHHHQNRFV